MNENEGTRFSLVILMTSRTKFDSVVQYFHVYHLQIDPSLLHSPNTDTLMITEMILHCLSHPQISTEQEVSSSESRPNSW